MRAEAIVLDARFLEDATSTNVGLLAGCGIAIWCRSFADKRRAKSLAGNDTLRTAFQSDQQAI